MDEVVVPPPNPTWAITINIIPMPLKKSTYFNRLFWFSIMILLTHYFYSFTRY